MSPPSSSLSFSSALQGLSRACKSRDYGMRRKRKRPGLSLSSSNSCFEVRPTPTKGGVGTFSLRDIPCGEILVSEHPVVFIPTPDNPNAARCCQACLVPLEDLHYQLGLSKSESLVGLEEHATVLQFTTTAAADDLTCACGIQWCGQTCRDFQRFEHALLCCRDPKNKNVVASRRFRDHAMETGSTPFLLAAQAIARVLGSVKRDSEKLGESADWKDDDLFWWREYSHPLYWELGSSPKEPEQLEKKATSEASHQLLLESFLASIRDMTAKDGGDASSFWTHMLNRICTLENFGEILGMLQCNVMEVEFPSPVQQYISHLQQIVEDAEDEENEDNGDQELDTKEYRAWVENYLAKQSPLESATESETNVLSSITGSGLFPILTLANHDCDPNASIEFLGESNQGSLVALRDIACGEEITITYIPNGDMDCGDETGDRFRHFQPTRTWLYLNQNANEDSAGRANEDSAGRANDDSAGRANEDSAGNEDSDQEVESVDQGEQGQPDGSNAGDCDDQVDDDDQDNASHADSSEENEDEFDVVTDGASWEDRAKSLLNYGFACHCARCEHEHEHEQKEVNIPYCRKMFSETTK
jgi:hypothetical protein